MAIPQPGDPQRPLALAANAAKALGGVSLGFGLLGGCGVAFIYGNAARPDQAALLVLAGGVLGMFIVPGFLYFYLVGHLKRYRMWAAIVLLVMASLHTVVMAIGFIRQAVAMSLGSGYPGETTGPSLQLLFHALFVAVGVLLIIYLSKSFGVLRMHRQPRGYAFEPIMAGQFEQFSPAPADPYGAPSPEVPSADQVGGVGGEDKAGGVQR